MSIFKYTLPSGQTYVVNGPAGATQSQADLIFYEQVAAGSLVGYRIGDTLANPKQMLLSFGLDRLDRGAAGVDEITVLAIGSGLPIVAGVPALLNIPIENPITQADIVNITGPVDPIGPLSSNQVRALMAQIVANVDQPADEMSSEKGVGKFGLDSLQLETAGYLKPGTTDKYCCCSENGDNSPEFVPLMSVPAIFTGKDGVCRVADILANEPLQNKIQQTLMKESYKELVTAGLIKETKPEPVSVSQGTVFTAQGPVPLAEVSVLPVSLPPSLGGKVIDRFNNALR